ncbi:MAG TPA: hypothetical protein PLR76_04920 [Hyphomonas sp.]|nr:hypothetical protein [Hyphomonas sp.]MCA8905009.1 hypothetical protein [Hyphomonas sp.]MCB9962452.1 hypothetical protein [Hyphomonas sp.]MCB9972096.1 hypothetical protein [Hyphomonas sp.]HPE47713.1 hypothetical protein [Hyphomonas sp.]
MLNDLTAHIANTSGLGAPASKKALGIVLNAAERQDSPFAAAMFKAIPATRKLSTRTGKDAGAPTGEIARLIEQTPGGKLLVARDMITALQDLGMDHKDIGGLLPSIATYMEDKHGLTGFGHLGDLIGSDLDAVEAAPKSDTRAA